MSGKADSRAAAIPTYMEEIPMAVEKKAYMRDAAYMVSIKRVADAMRFRGWIK